MGDLSECVLDRHFGMQLRVIGNVYGKKVKKSDYMISQHWIQLFRRASVQEKYARNCLMLLMYSQLKEMRRLGKPFTDMENSKRHLDDVLCEYNCKMDDNRDGKKYKGDNADNIFTNVACFGNNASTNVINEPKFNNNISNTKPRALEKDSYYKNKKVKPKQNPIYELPKTLEHNKNQELMLNICQSVMQAINFLKNWNGPNDQVNFISICFQNFLNDMPEMRANLTILDRRFENMLNCVAQHAWERHEKNVMILFDQLSKQQHRLYLAKREYNRRIMNPQDRQQKTHKDFFKEREQLLCEQEDIANGLAALIACNHYRNQYSFDRNGQWNLEYGYGNKANMNGESIIYNSLQCQTVNQITQMTTNFVRNQDQQMYKRRSCSYCQN